MQAILYGHCSVILGLSLIAATTLYALTKITRS